MTSREKTRASRKRRTVALFAAAAARGLRFTSAVDDHAILVADEDTLRMIVGDLLATPSPTPSAAGASASSSEATRCSR